MSEEELDLEHCRALLRQGSKSFSAASRLLPKRIQKPVTALYAFCRIADDAIDEANKDEVNAALSNLCERLDRVYLGRPIDHPVDRALSRAALHHKIPRPLMDALIEGFAWDAQGRRYETISEVYAYGARVAGTVGAMMTVLMGKRDALTLSRACDMGVAMQLTNIARDVGADARMGRLYLPMEWMRQEGLGADEFLADPKISPALSRVIERLVKEADLLYARADQGIARLPLDCRASIYAARLIYARIGRRIEKAAFDSVSKRAYVPLRTKIALLIKAFFGARYLRDREAEAIQIPTQKQKIPTLPETQFLVDAAVRT